MPKGDVVLSEAEYESVKALLRAHKAVADSTAAGYTRYIINLPEVCRPLVFAAIGCAPPVSGVGTVAIDESVLTNAILERLENL